jgi:hypothetical protein
MSRECFLLSVFYFVCCFLDISDREWRTGRNYSLWIREIYGKRLEAKALSRIAGIETLASQLSG